MNHKKGDLVSNEEQPTLGELDVNDDQPTLSDIFIHADEATSHVNDTPEDTQKENNQ